MDPIAQQLQALAFSEALAGDPMRAEIAAAMLELYLIGRINVTFDEATGEPTAELIEHSVPIIHSPMFAAPTLIPAAAQTSEEECTGKRQIGFKLN